MAGSGATTHHAWPIPITTDEARMVRDHIVGLANAQDLEIPKFTFGAIPPPLESIRDGDIHAELGGGQVGVNEVTISASQPVDGTELWLDTTTPDAALPSNLGAGLHLAAQLTMPQAMVALTWAAATAGAPPLDSSVWNPVVPQRLLCPRTGWYALSYSPSITAVVPNGASYGFEVRLNGTLLIRGPSLYVSGTGRFIGDWAYQWYLHINDYVEVWAGSTGATAGTVETTTACMWRSLP